MPSYPTELDLLRNVTTGDLNTDTLNVVGSVAVSGGATSANQTTEIGLLTDIKANQTNGTQLVDGSAHTQPVSGTVTVIQPTGTNLHVVIDSGTVTTITNVVHVDDNGGSLTVDGTVTANAGTGTFLVDGSAHTQPVSGTVTANAGTGNFTVVQPTGTNLHAVIDSGTITTITNVVHVDDNSGSLTVDGTVTATQATGTNLHTVVDSGSITATQATGTNLHTVVDSGSITANAGTNLNTSLLALDTSVNGILLAQGSTTASQTGPIVQGAVTTNAPSYTTGKTDPISLDTSGLLRVSLKDTPANTNKFLVTADAITFASPQHVINDAGSAVIGHVIVDSGSISATQGTSPWVVSGIATTTPTPASTATPTNVVSSASSVTLLSANSSRLGVTIENDSTKILYVKFGATASSSSYTVQMGPTSYYEVPYSYTGRIDGIWSSANGNARITELTA